VSTAPFIISLRVLVAWSWKGLINSLGMRRQNVPSGFQVGFCKRNRALKLKAIKLKAKPTLPPPRPH
jgi:hypothetical protein